MKIAILGEWSITAGPSRVVNTSVVQYMCKGPGSSVWDLCKGPVSWGNQGEVPVSGLSGEFGSTCVVDGPNT